MGHFPVGRDSSGKKPMAMPEPTVRATESDLGPQIETGLVSFRRSWSLSALLFVPDAEDGSGQEQRENIS